MTKNRELLFSITKKDLEITPFRGSGPGGQHKNKNATACRIKHRESGAVVESQEYKSFIQNKRAAFLKLPQHPKFKIWYAKVLWEIKNKKTIEEEIAEQMEDKNLRIEYKENGKWTVVDGNL